MDREEKRRIFNEYMDERGVSMRRFAKEIGYHESVLSDFKTGKREIPEYVIWGVNQGMKVIKLQYQLTK